MQKVNIMYHKQTNSWWTNSDLKEQKLLDYLNNNESGVGTIECNTTDKSVIADENTHEVAPEYVPKLHKMLCGLTVEDCKRYTDNPLGMGILIDN